MSLSMTRSTRECELGRTGKDTQELLAGKLRSGMDRVASAGKKVRAQVKDMANGKKTSQKPSTQAKSLPSGGARRVSNGWCL
jgi:hypothetical protein